MPDQTSNIYVISRDSHDVSDAKRFGRIVYLSDEILPKFQTNQLYRLFQPIIEVSEPQDYILVSGLSVATSIACSMFAITHNGKLNLLLFDSKSFCYRERRLDLSDLFQEKVQDILRDIQKD